MPRKPRIHLAGGLYHVILRGNGGQDLFVSPADRSLFYRLLDQGRERFGHRIHGFCLMSNHVHLVIQAGERPLARAMQSLASRYARQFNRQSGRKGHLFQGRYQALIVDSESYLLELVRYVHLNPVRAGLAADPAAYPWSGHRAYLGEEPLDWLTTEWVLSQFAGRLAGARAAYGAFVAEGLGQGHRPEFQAGATDDRVLGDDEFLDRLTPEPSGPRTRPDPARLAAAVLADYGLGPRDLAAPGRRRDCVQARGVIGYLASSLGAASLTHLSERFGRDPTTWSRATRAVELAADRDAALRARLERLETALSRP
jgi:REP element-mobilizing transposase RayT